MYIIRSMRMSVLPTDVIQVFRIMPNTHRAFKGGKEEGAFFPPWAKLDLGQSRRLICCWQP